jgi:hypothetical protein
LKKILSSDVDTHTPRDEFVNRDEKPDGDVFADGGAGDEAEGNVDAVAGGGSDEEVLVLVVVLPVTSTDGYRKLRRCL